MSELKQAQEFFGYPKERICGNCARYEEDCKEFVSTDEDFLEVGGCEAYEDTFKFDNGKPRCDLVPAEIIEAIGAVRTYGVQKYGEEYSYRKVEPKRYRAALMRHICAWLKHPHGKDEESGLPHLWHIACNVAFLCELDDKENENDNNATDRIH
jgi:hypothetical protein